MRAFRCEVCLAAAAFDAQRCPVCASALAFSFVAREIVVVEPIDDVSYSIASAPEAGAMWRCLNAAWGCNWLVPADGSGPWCASCRLTRGRPAAGDHTAIAAWQEAESSKRVLLFQLGELGLPMEGLVFDLVFVPGASGVTGHLNGLITVDLTEADEQRRTELRRLFGEQYRTLLGHLRHEVGHYYWPLLIRDAGHLDAFRRCFGDERADYQAALDHHYQQLTPSGWEAEHISAYAAVHPYEDWADTFAHYLHIRDTWQSAEALGLRVAQGEAPAPPQPSSPFTALLDDWQPMIAAVNAVARSLGVGDVYPFALTSTVIEKLSFVHERVADH